MPRSSLSTTRIRVVRVLAASAMSLATAAVLVAPGPAQAAGPTLLVSTSTDRTSPIALTGQALTGNAYVFVASPVSGTRTVTFYLDGATTPARTESIVPYDLMGTNGNGSAAPLDVAGLRSGTHSIAAVVATTGGNYRLQGSFSRSGATTPPGTGTFSPTSPVNQPLPAAPVIDPNSVAMVANLNSGMHNADIYEFGTSVYAGTAGTMRRLVCTMTGWGTCPLDGLSAPVNDAWKPSSGSDGALAIMDTADRKVFDLWQVARDADGTVKVFADGTVHVSWGGVTSLDGIGQSMGATGSGLSHLFGEIRTSEIQYALDHPAAAASAIPHALHFATQYTCASFRFPALKTDGGSGGACIPEGSRVYLDAATSCASVPGAGGGIAEQAICASLKKFGAFVTDTAGTSFAIGFEGPTVGLPGGSATDPYGAAGLSWDYYDMRHIPWSHLHVARQADGG